MFPPAMTIAAAVGMLALLLTAPAEALTKRTDELLWMCEGRAGDNDAQNLLEMTLCVGYLDGMMDLGTIANARNPSAVPFCIPESGISLDQARLIFIEWAKAHPAELHKTARMSTVIALAQAFPCNR